MSTTLQVVGIVLVVLVVQAAIWVLVLVALRRRATRVLADVRHELAGSGERILRGPERAVYRGGTGPYPRVKGNGIVVLTERRLLVRMFVGDGVEIPTSTITAVREAASFHGSRTGRRTHLIVETTKAAEVALFVEDSTGWAEALRAATT